MGVRLQSTYDSRQRGPTSPDKTAEALSSRAATKSNAQEDRGDTKIAAREARNPTVLDFLAFDCADDDKDEKCRRGLRPISTIAVQREGLSRIGDFPLL